MITADEAPKRPRFLTVEQVADELNIGLPTVRMLLKSGELRGMQIGGRGLWRVAAVDLEGYISEAYRVAARKITAGEIPDGEPPAKRQWTVPYPRCVDVPRALSASRACVVQ